MSDRRERLETKRSVAEAEPKGTSYEVKDRREAEGSGHSSLTSSLLGPFPSFHLSIPIPTIP